MIMSNMGIVKVKGEGAVVAAELECIIRSLLAEDVFIEEEIMDIVRNGFESDKKPKEEPIGLNKSELNELLDVLRKFLEKMER